MKCYHFLQHVNQNLKLIVLPICFWRWIGNRQEEISLSFYKKFRFRFSPSKKWHVDQMIKVLTTVCVLNYFHLLSIFVFIGG